MKMISAFFKRLFDLDTPVGRPEMWINFIFCFLVGFGAYYLIDSMIFDDVSINADFFASDVGFCVFLLSVICLVIFVSFYYVNSRGKNKEKADKFGMLSMIFLFISCLLGILISLGMFGGCIYFDSVPVIILLLSFCWFFFALLRRLAAAGYTKEMILKDFLKITVLLITFLVFMYIIHANYSECMPERNEDDVKISLACLVFIGCYFIKYFIVAIFFKDRNKAREKKCCCKEKIIRNFKDLFKGIYLFLIRIFDFKGISGRCESFIPMCVGMWGLISVFLFFGLDNIIDFECGNMSNGYCYVYNPYNQYSFFCVTYRNLKGIMTVLGIILLLTPLVIRRLRSAGLNPWWALGQLVFPLNIMVYLYCIFGKNKQKN